MGILNDLTIEKRDTIKNAGYNHVSIYECQLAKNKNFRKFAKNFTQEIIEPPIQSKPFTEEGQTQPNCFTASKKTRVDTMWTFVLCIPQFSTTKSIQLVILPKYSTSRSMTNLGTVLSNAKW